MRHVQSVTAYEMNTSRRHVAIIDDDESVCRSLGRLLHLAGFQPTAFTSAEEFIADPFRTRFSCLLIDIQLGGMPGTDLHRQLVAEGCGVPVIYITAHDIPAAKAAARDRGR
jgi:FixJ family two-component response regulator